MNQNLKLVHEISEPMTESFFLNERSDLRTVLSGSIEKYSLTLFSLKYIWFSETFELMSSSSKFMRLHDERKIIDRMHVKNMIRVRVRTVYEYRLRAFDGSECFNICSVLYEFWRVVYDLLSVFKSVFKICESVFSKFNFKILL